MLEVKDRIGRTLVIFFIVAVILISSFSLYTFFAERNAASSPDGKIAAVYVLSEQQIEAAYKHGYVNLERSDILSYAELKSELDQTAARDNAIYLVTLCVILGMATATLWFILKRQNAKRSQALITALCSVEEDFAPSAALAKMYAQLERHFEENLKSFKKLNAYISHEQKNALSRIRAKLEYDGHRDYLKSIDDVSASIEDILTISDSSSEEMFEETDCVLICAEVCDVYRKIGHTVSYTFDEDDGVIMAKPRWIVRAVSNLLDNAIKYGGEQPIELALTRKYDSVIITVTDHGCGIPKEEQHKIFKHRYRIKDLNKDGYGIGLNLVSHVCENCGGFVWVESAPNSGSTFYLSFPAYDL